MAQDELTCAFLFASQSVCFRSATGVCCCTRIFNSWFFANVLYLF